MLHLPVTHVGRLFHPGIIAVWIALVPTLAAYGQVSPEDHAKHHPGQGQEKKPTGGEMGGMMCGVPPPQAKELYPSLMDLPELSPEKREEIQRQAHKRMHAGVALLSQGLDRLSKAAPGDDYKAMQEAISQMREGLAIFESGLAAHRALAEGKTPRNVALQWFKHEMNLEPPIGPEFRGGVLGLSWFHFFVMVVLIGFSATMIWMYFYKMQRAALLLQALTIGTPPSPAARATSGTSTATRGNAGSLTPELPGKWSGKLVVSRIFQETPNVKTFRLMNPIGGVLPFSYLPGQFLTVMVASDGQPRKHTYTIAGSVKYFV